MWKLDLFKFYYHYFIISTEILTVNIKLILNRQLFVLLKFYIVIKNIRRYYLFFGFFSHYCKGCKNIQINITLKLSVLIISLKNNLQDVIKKTHAFQRFITGKRLRLKKFLQQIHMIRHECFLPEFLALVQNK